MARAPSVYGGSVRSVDSRVLNYILQNRQAALDGELEEGENPPSPVQSERSEARFDRFNNQRANLDGPAQSVEPQQPPDAGPQPQLNTETRRSRERSRSPDRRRSRRLLDRSRSPLRRDRSVSRERRPRSPIETRQPPRPPIVRRPRRVIPRHITEGLSSFMAKGVITAESKEVQEVFDVEFEQEGFSLNPPTLDDWMARKLKDQKNRKTVEAAEKIWLSAQFKVMDIAPPLLNLVDSLQKLPGEADVKLLDAASAALFQWARAFNHITRRRRNNVLSTTSPRSEYLLDIPESFSRKEAIRHLFGQTFLDSMLEQAKMDETFRRIDEANAATPGQLGVQGQKDQGSKANIIAVTESLEEAAVGEEEDQTLVVAGTIY